MDKTGLIGGSIQANVNGRPILLRGDIILMIGKQDTCTMNCTEGVRKVLTGNNKIDVKYLRGGKEYLARIDTSENRKNFLSK